MAMCNTPGQCDLGSILAVLLANLDQHRIVHQLAHVLAAAVDLILVAERAVLSDVDALLLVELVEVELGEVWVAFDLVSGGYDVTLAHQAFELGFREVRDANGLAFAVLDELLHRFVGIDVVRIPCLNFVVVLREHAVATLERRRPVHQVQVEIVCVEIFQRCVAGLLDIFRVMAVIPELGGDEDLASRNAALLNALRAGRLGAITG